MSGFGRFFCSGLFLVAVLCSGCVSSVSQNIAKNHGYSQRGIASFYADSLQGNKTASGAIFKQTALTAAHKKLPFGSRVKVTNRNNGKSVVVVINDRGPFVRGRIIDLSKAAFRKIADLKTGVVDVTIEVLP